MARKRPPHFPVTLIYELGEGIDNRIVIFDSPGIGKNTGWWKSINTAGFPDANDNTKDNLRDILTQARNGNENWEPLIRDGNWPGESVGLPMTVLVYTTGSLEPWQALFHREPSAANIDIVSQADDYNTTLERPAGWNRQQELDYQAMQATEESRAELKQLQQLAEESTAKEHDQTICQLLDPMLLKFALTAVSLHQAMQDYHHYATDEAIQDFIKQIRDNPDKEQGLRRLLSQVGWVWPVSVVLQVDFNPDSWGEREAMQKSSLLQALYMLSNEVVREPEPSTQRRLFFDLKAKATSDTKQILQENAMGDYASRVTTYEYVGDALIQFLGGPIWSSFSIFKTLLDLRRQGLLTDIQIAIRKADVEDILLFDELSDGEQVYLGRMALFHLLEGESDALLLLDEPEVHFNDKWKREIVDIIDGVLKERANDVLIATHSSIALTDVFNDEIILFQKRSGHSVPIDIRSTTFGADPSEVMIRLFGVPDSMGERALEWLDAQLERQWTKNDLPELEKLLERVGPGFYRSELRGILRTLKENAAQN
ncbi:AAA family ATPase [Nitrosomonas sp. Is37]|uniref:AAA family ATPase n=1 Tax=Nitrosomonas sp. Is37 TaxID=3080535 RepID=UPI00294AF841|nr:AAA family ATPase [Nitrosomonas sp. Is37]MDV6345296.1 AAA family ATPase [Nitrosomonas sp. Is37]